MARFRVCWQLIRRARAVDDESDYQSVHCVGKQTPNERFAEGELKVGLALVLLFCRSESIHDNASSPSVRRAMFIDFTGAQAALRQEGHIRDPTECMSPGRQT